MREASYYTKYHDGRVQCTLCPHHCIIRDGARGICKVRKNVGGVLYAESYGLFSAIHLDPVEKKPLYHFYPGQMVLSLGSVGCNLSCIFCQNCEISQVTVDQHPELQMLEPEKLAYLSRRQPGNIGLAYTYNEPAISFELLRETAPLIRNQGQKNVMITNGFIESEPLEELLPFIDAFNVDLKGFTEAFYRRYTRSRLTPILQSLKQIRKSDAHLEVTNLIIPGANDDESIFRTMIEWIEGELGRKTVLHLSRYFPRFKMNTPPTPSSTIIRLYELARERLDYVYTGNIEIPDTQNTYCPGCHSTLIQRTGYSVKIHALQPGGLCGICGYHTGIITGKVA